LLEHEDTKWKQRAKQSWYQNGDRNTPFLHAWASHIRRINTIKWVIVEEGRRWSEPTNISSAFISFYQHLFTTRGTIGRVEFLAGLYPRVSKGMNNRLFCKFEVVKVNKALTQMHPLKSLGPDGFSACFYQNSWSTVLSDVCKAVLDFLNDEIFYAAINVTNIALSPR
jgi:hypothetical protein